MVDSIYRKVWRGGERWNQKLHSALYSVPLRKFNSRSERLTKFLICLNAAKKNTVNSCKVFSHVSLHRFLRRIFPHSFCLLNWEVIQSMQKENVRNFYLIWAIVFTFLLTKQWDFPRLEMCNIFPWKFTDIISSSFVTFGQLGQWSVYFCHRNNYVVMA